MNSKNMRLYFTLLFLGITHIAFSLGKDPIDESRVEKAIRAVNTQIQKNKELISKGRFDETKYIVDVRGNWWQGTAENVTPDILTQADNLLREINVESGLAFYVLLSAPWVNQDQFIIHNSDRTTTVYHNGQVETFPAESDETAARIKELNELTERISQEYTAAVATRSRISDESNKGILLNIEAILPLAIDEENRKILEYRPFVALGKRLSAWSVEQTYNEIIKGLDLNRSFYEDFSGTLEHFIVNVGKNAENIYKNTPGVLVDESTLGNIEGTVFTYSHTVDQLHYKLSNFSTPADDVREQNFGDIRLLDFAGISTADPNFLSSIQRQVDDFQGEINLTNLPVEKLKLYIIVTSDAFTFHEKTAIQLAHEKRSQLEGEYFILAIHFRLNDPETTVVHAASVFNSSVQRKLIDQRNELGYNLYRHRETKQLIMIRNDIFNSNENLYNRDAYGYYVSPYDFVANFAYRVPGSTNIIPNAASTDWMAIAVLAWAGGELEQFLRAHEDVAAQWVLDIAFTAATGGIYGVTKTIIQAGVTVTKGAVIDVALQTALIMILNTDLTFEQALDSVDYGAALYSGVENFIGDWKTVAAMACIRQAMVEGFQSDKEGSELIKEISLGCGQAVLSQLLFNEAPKKLKPILLRYMERNYPAFIASLARLKADLSNNDIVKLLKLLGVVDDVNLKTYKSSSLKHIVPASWANDIVQNGKSARAFWNDASKEFYHYVDGDYYIKHDRVTGELLIGNTKTGEILSFEKRAASTPDEYPRLINPDQVYKSVPFADFESTIRNASTDQKRIAYRFWGEEKWDELFNIFNPSVGPKINDGWPPFNGTKSIFKTETGAELHGKIFDRFQLTPATLSGRYASPVYQGEGLNELHFIYDVRALKDDVNSHGMIYFKFKIKEEAPANLKFEYGEIIPWWGRSGLGDQIKSSESLADLLRVGHIEIIEQMQNISGTWTKIK